MKIPALEGLFTSQDSKYSLKTAFYVTLVPFLMLGLIIYSLWLLITINYSYFMANGFPLNEETKESFILLLLESQLDYLPYIGLFFITVFFIGVFLAYVVIRPFNQVAEMCEDSTKDFNSKINGLNNQKLIVKLGKFICDYRLAMINKTKVTIPKDIEKAKGPVLDLVFYFQFILLIGTLTAFTVFAMFFFTQQLHESLVQTALQTLKAHKGMEIFLRSQEEVLNLVMMVSALLTCVLYVVIARVIIAKIEGVTYGYVRNFRDVVNGDHSVRLSPRQEDPGQQAALSINKLLDKLHPGTRKVEVASENPAQTIIAVPGKA